MHHILDEAEYLVEGTRGLSYAQFMADATLKRAFVRSIEIIGEATKQVSDDIKSKYSHLEWRSMAGMRDKLVHSYFGIDYAIVWDVAINKAPTLCREIRQIIASESSA